MLQNAHFVAKLDTTLYCFARATPAISLGTRSNSKVSGAEMLNCRVIPPNLEKKRFFPGWHNCCIYVIMWLQRVAAQT